MSKAAVTKNKDRADTELRVDPLARFRPLARLALHLPLRASERETGDELAAWVDPLARLYEAASRGIGHLPWSVVRGSAPERNWPSALIAVEGERAMLPRTAHAWQIIRSALSSAHGNQQTALAGISDETVASALNRLLPPFAEHDDDGKLLFSNAEQRVAVAALIDAQVGVLTGGPGTGKTTTAAALLALRCALQPDLSASDIIVCAPTGKAANRLRQSLNKAAARLQLTSHEKTLLGSLRPITLHRALGWNPSKAEDGGPWRFHSDNPLSARLVIVDEASMADVELMAALVLALGKDSALILLGDRDQLDSVEAGGVLAEMVARGSSGKLPAARRASLAARCNCAGELIWQDHSAENITDPLPGLAMALQWSFRAKDAPWILDLAALTKPGAAADAAHIARLCEKYDDSQLLWTLERDNFYQNCQQYWAQLRDSCAHWRIAEPPDEAMLQQTLEQFQLLVLTNQQVDSANAIGLSLLSGINYYHGHKQSLPLAHGCPLIIESNDPSLDLANGDVGIALGSGPRTTAMGAIFPGHSSAIPLARLPQHRAAFAITIHKSQGSEWRRIAIDIGSKPHPLLDRRLLYTAITRASHSLILHSSRHALSAALENSLTEGN